jgi:hypothetical protein
LRRGCLCQAARRLLQNTLVARLRPAFRKAGRMFTRSRTKDNRGYADNGSEGKRARNTSPDCGGAVRRAGQLRVPNGAGL